MHDVLLIVLDVDGTLTDGTLLYAPDGTHAKSFHVHDGLGIVMAQAAGLRVAVLSGRTSRAVETRLAELKVGDVIQNCGDKAAAMRGLLGKYGLRPEQAAYVGDDLNDLPAFEAAGVRIAVADASQHLTARADWVTPRRGGAGAVRDAVEEILRRQGRLDAAVAAYLAHTRPGEVPEARQ
jgi:3-deoxy-D-manno-octulosonate 8-phosphate phosphatase (KDO 8-P phosphatase)